MMRTASEHFPRGHHPQIRRVIRAQQSATLHAHAIRFQPPLCTASASFKSFPAQLR